MWMTGENLFHEITVSFLEAARGVRKELKLPTAVTLEVEIPPATEDGAILSFPGWGFPGYGGGEPGNLNLQVKVTPHPVLKRQGADILAAVTIDAASAARGTTIAVPTLSGEQQLRVRKDAKSGDVLTIKGAGLRLAPDAPRGDQKITLLVR
jgi:DnaJ-class molecular chaperone